MAERRTEEECRLHWEAQGKPLFGKLWSYEEMMSADRPMGFKRGCSSDKKELETPSEWPPDTVIDKTGAWVFWLPEGWRQGVRTSAAGKMLKCYFNPEHRRFWHKKDIERLLGMKLAEREPPPMKEEGEEKSARMRYVTDADSIPDWPSKEDDDWLPKDWRVCFRQLPSGLHKVYVPPGQDEGFLYQKAFVPEYLSGVKTTLSLFGSSRPMKDICKTACERGTSRVGPDGYTGKKKKKRRTGDIHIVGSEDFAPCDDFQVVALPGAAPVELLETSGEVRSLLKERGFPDPQLLAVFRTSPGGPLQPVADLVGGLYTKLSGTYDGRPCYQYVSLDDSGSKLICRGCYIFWVDDRNRWQIGGMQVEKAGYAVCSEDVGLPEAVTSAWTLLKELPVTGGAAEVAAAAAAAGDADAAES